MAAGQGFHTPAKTSLDHLLHRDISYAVRRGQVPLLLANEFAVLNANSGMNNFWSDPGGGM